MLDSRQLSGLNAHKYSCVGRSITEPVFQIFWNWLVELVPLWVAPNLITAVGLLLNLITSVAIFLYSPHATEEAPRWLYALWSFSFFTYQALDAIDGKQARRTKSSSPLGELFDHGCDAVSLAFVNLSAACSVLLGSQIELLFLFYFATVLVFYVAHWHTYISGTMSFGKIDCTEAQLALMLVHLVSAIWGPRVWDTVLYSGVDLRVAGVYLTMITSVGTVVANILVILKGGQGKNGSTIAGTSVLSPAFPMLALFCLSYYTFTNSPTQVMQSSPVVAALLMGMVSSKLTINLVIAHMSKSPMPLFDQILIAPVALALNAKLGVLPEDYFMSVLLIFAMFYVAMTSTLICQQICEHMGIYCFTLGKRPRP